jgi:hypothetical protein
VGAECGSPARSDLTGGRPDPIALRAVPTGTRVTRLRALLKACREALRDGEVERADRILADAQLILAPIDGMDE